MGGLRFPAKALHEEVGARKFVLVGIGLIGCTPNAVSNQSRNGSYCDEEKNNAAFMFNVKLKSLVDNFNNNFYSDSKFIFINSTAGTLDSSLGFTVSNASCCPSGTNGFCVPNETPCENRTTYVFWDQFHPTESVNQIVAISSYNGSNPAFTYPMDITHLVQS
ncbi:hypothetical protein VNO80_25345 [Phaseolus coccineus]|uniref:GDSL esterase/lipase n=1 Tax=Phaseolus coccineus TaxID=3886 RepID=A0AAN9QNP0_PHACN